MKRQPPVAALAVLIALIVLVSGFALANFVGNILSTPRHAQTDRLAADHLKD
jgi:hypothetical protein